MALCHIKYQLPYLNRVELQTVLGQEIGNHLRDSCAVSNLPSFFGKFKHALLTRNVVSSKGVESSIHSFITRVLQHPEKLSSLSAVTSTDIKKSVTLTASFSCLDRGRSNAESIQWWVGNFSRFEPLTELRSDVGGAESSTRKLDGSTTDIVLQCLSRQVDQTSEKYRLVEHANIHDGTGVYFSKMSDQNSPSKPIVPSAELFFRLYNLRMDKSEKDEVIYDPETKIPISLGLDFTTGCRVITPPDTSSSDTNKDYKVPATLTMALRSTVGAGVEEANSVAFEPRTTRVILILTIISTGVPLALASFLVIKFVADGAAVRFEELRSGGVNAVITGHRQAKWTDYAHHMMILVEFFAGIILLAPLVLAIIEGSADPEQKLEVTSGLSVFYGSSHKAMSDDEANPIAGAPFVVTVWTRMRVLNEGFYLSFTISLTAVITLALLVSIHELRRLNCILPSYEFTRGGFSSMKTIGSALMWLKTQRRSAEKVNKYRVLVRFRDDLIFDNRDSIRPLTVVSEEIRRKARKYKHTDDDKFDYNKEVGYECDRLLATFSSRGQALEEARNTFCLVANVTLKNESRRSAVLCRSKFFHNNLPREWYYILETDAANGFETNSSIYAHRTHGTFPHDKYLVIARLGLLEHLGEIKSVEIMQNTSEKSQPVASDGCTVRIVETTRSFSTDTGYMSVNHDVHVKVNYLSGSDHPDEILRGTDPAATSSLLSGFSMDGSLLV